MYYFYGLHVLCYWATIRATREQDRKSYSGFATLSWQNSSELFLSSYWQTSPPLKIFLIKTMYFFLKCWLYSQLTCWQGPWNCCHFPHSFWLDRSHKPDFLIRSHNLVAGKRSPRILSSFPHSMSQFGQNAQTRLKMGPHNLSGPPTIGGSRQGDGTFFDFV